KTYHEDLDGLYVLMDQSVPPAGDIDAGSVGVGMSGAGTYVVPTAKGMGIEFTPTPNYWIAFGKYTDGNVMKIRQLTSPQQIVFPEKKFHADAVYTPGVWDVKYS